MENTTNSSVLHEALLALKPNLIYTLAKPSAIAAAGNAFADKAVNSFHWNANGQSMMALVLQVHRVLFTCKAGGALDVSCSCGGVYEKPCQHVLVSFMTMMRVLRGSKFHANDLPPERVQAFREQLKAPEEKQDAPQVIISEEGQYFRFDFDANDGNPSWMVAGPPSGMEWLLWQQREPDRVVDGFLQWLASKSENVEILLRFRDCDVPLPKAQPLVAAVSAYTQMSVQSDRVEVRRSLVNADGETADAFADIGYGLVFLREKKAFAKIDAASAWGTVANDSGISCAKFNAQSLPFMDIKCALLDGNGATVEPVNTGVHGVISCAISDDKIQVELLLADEGDAAVPLEETFGLEVGARQDGVYAPLLKSGSRRRRVMEYFSRLLQESAAEVAREASRDAAFTSFQMYGEDAMKYLAAAGERIKAFNEKRLIANPARLNPWCTVENAGTALGSAIAAFFSVFPDEHALRSNALVFEIETLRFLRKLGALLAAAKDCGVTVQLDGKPPRVEKLDVRIRAEASQEIDWFALHPEARAGNLSFSHDQWESILRLGYFRDEKTGELVAFEQDSLDALGLASTLLDGGKDGAFRLPRLRIFEWLALRGKGIACDLPEHDAKVLESLLQTDSLPTVPLPKGLNAELREYQQHGYDWLAFLYQHRFGACLADDMGLGKTLQAIALLAAIADGTVPRQHGHAPHLAVVPPTLLFNWQSEVARFAPSLKIHEYVGQERVANFAGADIVLTTYELVRRDIEILEKLNFDVAVFDEAQAVKNFAAARTQALMRINAGFRLCVTGTPMENRVEEFHSIMENAVPGLFGDRREFARHFEAGLPVIKRAAPFLLRRTKEKILAELPPKMESDIWFPLSERQKEYYTRAVGEVRSEVLAAYGERPAQQAGIIALTALLRLRQICIAPAMLGAEETDSPKLEYLVEQLAELTGEDHAALVFSQFVKALDITANALEAAGLPFLRLDGSTPTNKRREMIEAFQNGTAPGIFLISLKTGGAGLNLTRASYIFHLDPWWNPSVERQATDRAHRIGQKQSVFVQRLLMRHTIEEKMMVLKERKAALFHAVVEQNETANTSGASALSAEDFRFLIEE